MSGFDPASLVRDYGDIYGEARACRGDCALFDYSFMARARICGAGVPAVLAKFQPRPVDDLPCGGIRYALRLGRGGRVEADLTIWNLGGGCFEVMSGRRRDIFDLLAACDRPTDGVDLTGETAILAIQGPSSLAAFAGLTDVARLARLSYFAHDLFEIGGVECRVGRLGYTGERGFEVITGAENGAKLWRIFAERARPAGFAAADILRIEAGFILFANECRIAVKASELGLGGFAGTASTPPSVRLVCFRAKSAAKPVLWRPRGDARRPAKQGEITITSACHSPRESGTVGLGFVTGADAEPGTVVADPGGDFGAIQVLPIPLYDAGKKKPRGAWTGADIAAACR